jgi:hypothetical protein
VTHHQTTLYIPSVILLPPIEQCWSKDWKAYSGCPYDLHMLRATVSVCCQHIILCLSSPLLLDTSRPYLQKKFVLYKGILPEYISIQLGEVVESTSVNNTVELPFLRLSVSCVIFSLSFSIKSKYDFCSFFIPT